MVSLQFITHQTDRYTYFESALMALEGGCKWIQLRMKEAPYEEVEAVALQLKPLCKEKEAILLLDDHVELAKKLEVDGVHLGKKDMPIDQARQLLGEACRTALPCRSGLPRHRSFPVYHYKEKPESCSGTGRLCRYFISDERSEYRTAGSSHRRNHL